MRLPSVRSVYPHARLTNQPSAGRSGKGIWYDELITTQQFYSHLVGDRHQEAHGYWCMSHNKPSADCSGKGISTRGASNACASAHTPAQMTGMALDAWLPVKYYDCAFQRALEIQRNPPPSSQFYMSHLVAPSLDTPCGR